MPKLLKEIIPQGTFLVNSNQGRIRRTFDQDYLERLATSGNSMLEAGLRIPAPFDHNKSAVPEVNGAAASSFNNAGYWEHFTIKPNDKGQPSLYGLVDLPGSKEDPNSPYYKALNTAKEVSINAHDEYTDGLGRKWKDAILHVALVNHPVVPDQTAFSDGSTVINMSMLETEQDSETLVSQLKSLLQESVQISLPESTCASTFLRDLLVAASQIKLNRPNQGTTLEPVPIYMSVGDTDMPMTQAQAESLVATKAINPVTSKPWTLEDLGFKPASAASSIELSALKAELAEKDQKLQKAVNLVSAFAAKLKEDTTNAIKRRIDTLVAKGTITQSFADANLVPKLAYEMSVDTTSGKLADHQLEIVLSALEAQAPAAASVPSFDGTIQPLPLQVNEPSASDLEESLKEMCSFIY